MNCMEYISGFLRTVEGFSVRGYVPCWKDNGKSANYFGHSDPAGYRAMYQSGVTIGCGVDLGQTSRREHEAFGIEPVLMAIFAPYYGRRKQAAIDALYAKPLVISDEQADRLSMIIHRAYVEKYVAPGFEKDSGKSFWDQPKEACAVIASLCYQKGVGGVRKDFPVTWRHLTNLDWRAASHELQFGFSKFTQRRRMEGRLLFGVE